MTNFGEKSPFYILKFWLINLNLGDKHDYEINPNNFIKSIGKTFHEGNREQDATSKLSIIYLILSIKKELLTYVFRHKCKFEFGKK